MARIGVRVSCPLLVVMGYIEKVVHVVVFDLIQGGQFSAAILSLFHIQVITQVYRHRYLPETA